MREFHPPHIYQNNVIYFITGRTVAKINFFNSQEKKNIFLRVLKIALTKFSYQLYAFVINDNHYHLLVKIEAANQLPRFILNLHSNSARLVNQMDNQAGRQIWYQYWDRCVRSEKDFWTRFNYIHHNPIKHGYLKHLNELSAYKFCSYYVWLQKKEIEWINSVFEMYPIIDFTLEEKD